MQKQAAIALIIRKTDKPKFPVGYRREILTVTNRKYSTLTLPGGKLDPGETPLDAAVREVKEETNLHLSAANLQHIGSSISANAEDRNDDCLVHFYFARSVTGLPASVEKGTDIVWCTLEELLSASYFAPYYKRHLPEGIDRFADTVFQGATMIDAT